MLEEFERLVRIPMKNKPLFERVDESFPPEIIARALHMDEREAEANLEVKGNTKGFSLSFLLERAHTLLKAEIWDACYSTIALAIYGIILLPNMDGFIDMAAICVFLTGNPVPTLLADVYYYMSHRTSPKTGVWVEQTDASWHQKLGSLRSEDLSWYSKEYISMDIIFSCGDFPNLPLIGTQVCVNSNPVLSLRQLGYPMEGPPDARYLEAFLFLDFGVENPSLFQQIREAWKNVNQKGRADLGRANGITEEPYFHWVKERAEVIKIPFVTRISVPLPEPKLTHIPFEEVDELKTTMEKLERENEELKLKLQQLINEKNTMKWELERKDVQLQANVEKFNKEEHKRKKIKVGLEQADLCLDTLKGQLRKAQKE
ncbi:uncharacterized protein LOC127130012 [Lathyrus oleraceus]|uniref:uncharacterized protein LOC127130012 n=1 Tax=Pisum sativum TaxID=3888 RepID=UPI0021D0E6ED|nr:uncharacterized protein LOC127130012 [Pisum sativum]